jgi:hypothetical protein
MKAGSRQNVDQGGFDFGKTCCTADDGLAIASGRLPWCL